MRALDFELPKENLGGTDNSTSRGTKFQKNCVFNEPKSSPLS